MDSSAMRPLSQPHPRRAISAILVVLVLALALVAGPASSAQAAFTRPGIREIAGPFHGGPEGIDVDGSDRLWVAGGAAGGGKQSSLNVFKPISESNEFEQTLEIEGLDPPAAGLTWPEKIAINDSTGTIYISGVGGSGRNGGENPVEAFDSNGGFIRRFAAGDGGGGGLAVDNSGGPSHGDVYLSSQSHATISRFSDTGEPLDFADAGALPYVSGNTITDSPEAASQNRSWQEHTEASPHGVAVGPDGEILTFDPFYFPGALGGDPVHRKDEEAAIVEYDERGTFLRAIQLSRAPQLPRESLTALFSAQDAAIAVDPTNGDILLGLTIIPGGQPALEGAIDEFDSTGRFLGQIRENSSGVTLTSAERLAFDSAGNLYVGDLASGRVDVFGPGHFLPGLRLGEAEQATPTTAVLAGEVNAEAGVNPEHAGLTACTFEYVTEAAFRSSGFEDLSSGGVAPCEPAAGTIPADESFYPVKAAISGLSSGTTYFYRLSATLGGAKGGLPATTSAAPFTAPHAPLVESVSVDNLSSAFADLHATVNPLGAATTYQFQYLTSAQFAADGESFEGPSAPVGVPLFPEPIGSGGKAVEVTQHVGGLTAGAVYHFRVLARNSIGMAEAEGVFSTLPAIEPGLPDGRAYELVTPPDKGSAEDMFGELRTDGEYFNEHDIALSSASGDQLLLEANAAFGAAPASSLNAYVFSREPGGWSYVPLASPGLGLQNLFAGSVVADPLDFSRVSFVDSVGSSASESGTSNAALLGPTGGPYETLITDPASTSPRPETSVSRIAGASQDLSRVVLQTTTLGLVPGGPAEVQDPGSRALFAYSGGSFSTLNVKSNGKLLSRCGAVLGGAKVLGKNSVTTTGGTAEGQAYRAISADGSRVLFTSPDPLAAGDGPGCWDGSLVNPPQLYRREGTETFEVSAPSPTAPESAPALPAEYVGAAGDGSRVYFVSKNWLTGDHPPVHDFELYEWRSPGTPGAAGAGAEPSPCQESSPTWVPASAGCLARVTAGAAGGAGQVSTVPAISSSGSAVYFTADAVLASNRGADGSFAAAGHCESSNLFEPCPLYRYEPATATTTYVATVEGIDTPRYGTGCLYECPAGNWYTTPSGRFLLFATSRELTGYQTLAAKESECKELPRSQGANNGHCDELYRFDADGAPGQQLTCVSCNPSGAQPTSMALFARSSGTGQPQRGPVLALSDDGSRAFFDTADPLVPNDVNGSLDVYEWEAGGVGTCQAERGCISLLSSGRDASPSFFLGADPTGANVFVGTHSRLVPADGDTEGDVYDARMCTAEQPCITQGSAKEGVCEGDACSHPVPAPNDPTPASSSYQGVGNGPTHSSCARGKVKRRGRCVVKKKGAHRRARHKPHRHATRKPGGKK